MDAVMEQAQAYYETPGHNVAAGVALSVLVLVVVALRFYGRMIRGQQLKMDDWLIIPAAVATIGVGISIVWGTTVQAVGYRTKTPPEFLADPFNANTEQLTIISKHQIEFAYGILLPLILGCVKASFLFFYMRIFSINKKSKTNILLVVLIVFVAFWAVAFSLAIVFGCGTYVEAHWGSTHDLEQYCRGSMTVVLVLCLTDFFADVLIIAIPVPLVWRLNLPQKHKIAISGVFLLGLVTVALSLTRLIIEGRAVVVGFAPGSDSVLVITEYIYWGFVECSVAILAACLPTFSVLASSYFVKKWAKRVQTVVKYRSGGRTKNTPPKRAVLPEEITLTGLDSVHSVPAEMYSGRTQVAQETEEASAWKKATVREEV